MTSMAANGNIRLYFGADFHDKVEKKSNAVMAIDKRIRSGSNLQKVNLGNVKKVNGINVAENEINPRTWSVIDDDHQLPLHSCLLGKFVDQKLVFRQTFVIRSYEIGPDKTATMETLMNLLQETALNHVTGSGLAGNGFGSTREMIIRKLIWVVTRIHVQVQRYSSWGDVVEIDTWVDAAGKNGMRRDWIIRDYDTKDIITRATSTWVIMNRETRKLSKIPQQVRQEVVPFYTKKIAVAQQDDHVQKIDKLTDETAQTIKSGLAPRWSDMDANQHVNNVRYIGYILESVPMEVLGEYNMKSMTLEYRRECQQSNLLESLTSTAQHSNGQAEFELEYTHLLRMQTDKAEIIRARTQWQPKLIL